MDRLEQAQTNSFDLRAEEEKCEKAVETVRRMTAVS